MPSNEPLAVPADDFFVIQEHHARQLHWDFRLSRHGVLVSWAVPKGLPKEPGIERLAIHTEDHPLEYGSFSGEIPAGEYGAGQVYLWDHGRYELVRWTDSRIDVVLHGERVQGQYTLIHKDDAWVLRRHDPPTEPDWQPLPQALPAMLATAAQKLPTDNGDQWAYEFKWDGIRAITRIEGGRIALFSRSGKDITATFPELRPLGAQLGSTQVLLDGEIVALEHGRPSFAMLQKRMHVDSPTHAKRLAHTYPAHYLIFDLLHLDGRATITLPYQVRRELLEGLELNGTRWLTPAYHQTSGEVVLHAAQEQGLEGVVAKRLTSKYYPGRRSPDWIKVAYLRTQEVVIGGWRFGKGQRAGRIGSLLVGQYDDNGLRYIGQVGTGFTQAALTSLAKMLSEIQSSHSSFSAEIPRYRGQGAQWVKPVLVGEVVFREWTDDLLLRHPSWRGLRLDKQAKEVRIHES